MDRFDLILVFAMVLFAGIIVTAVGIMVPVVSLAVTGYVLSIISLIALIVLYANYFERDLP